MNFKKTVLALSVASAFAGSCSPTKTEEKPTEEPAQEEPAKEPTPPVEENHDLVCYNAYKAADLARENAKFFEKLKGFAEDQLSKDNYTRDQAVADYEAQNVRVNPKTDEDKASRKAIKDALDAAKKAIAGAYAKVKADKKPKWLEHIRQTYAAGAEKETLQLCPPPTEDAEGFHAFLADLNTKLVGAHNSLKIEAKEAQLQKALKTALKEKTRATATAKKSKALFNKTNAQYEHYQKEAKPDNWKELCQKAGKKTTTDVKSWETDNPQAKKDFDAENTQQTDLASQCAKAQHIADQLTEFGKDANSETPHKPEDKVVLLNGANEKREAAQGKVESTCNNEKLKADRNLLKNNQKDVIGNVFAAFKADNKQRIIDFDLTDADIKNFEQCYKAWYKHEKNGTEALGDEDVREYCGRDEHDAIKEGTEFSIPILKKNACSIYNWMNNFGNKEVKPEADARHLADELEADTPRYFEKCFGKLKSEDPVQFDQWMRRNIPELQKAAKNARGTNSRKM